MVALNDISEALQIGDAEKVKELVKQALEENIVPKEILENGLIKGMGIIGEKFKKNEVYVPEVLIAARAMHAGMDILEPLLAESDSKPAGTIVIGTVKGDLHDIGKNLVTMMLQGAGFKVVDIGIDVECDDFVKNAQEENPDVIALSALLTTTMPQMKTVIDALNDAGVESSTMIGGAPVTQDYADEIGASGYAPDAASAVDSAKSYIL